MYDLDLKRLIGAMPDFVTDKIYFVSKSIKDDANTRRLSRLGKVIGIGTQGFATELGHLRLDFPPKDPGLLPVFVREPEYKVESKFNDRDIRDLLVSGITKTTLFSVGDLNGNSDAYTVRRADKNSWIRLVAKQQRPMLVHGEVGAGKTVLLNQISYAKHCLGRKVFFIDREIGNAKDIIEYFNYYENECSIFFDDINGFPTLIKGILALEKSSIEIYVGARTNLLVAGVGTINSRMNNQSYSTYEVTQLSRTEIRRFSEYLTLNGIWARDAELSSFEKENLIVTRCGSNVRDLILYLYEDGALHSRVLEIVSALQNLQKAERSLFILCAIASIAGLSSSFDLTLLQEISEYPGTIDDIENTIKAQGVTGLIERSSGEIKFKSAVIAEFYLRNAVSPSEIFDVSFAALVNLEKFFWDDENINFYCRELLKFSLYERAIGRRRLGDMNRDFFHRCRVLKISQKDPLFHVQRSIAALSMNDFELSEKYIETAYAIARTRTKFDPYQVDTHKAKFIFMRALASNTPPDLAEIYDAFSLLQGVLKRRSSDLYHPISAMRQMSDIAKKFNQSFNSEDRSKFLSYLNSAAQIAQKTADQGKYNEIRRIHNSLKSAIDILKN